MVILFHKYISQNIRLSCKKYLSFKAKYNLTNSTCRAFQAELPKKLYYRITLIFLLQRNKDHLHYVLSASKSKVSFKRGVSEREENRYRKGLSLTESSNVVCAV